MNTNILSILTGGTVRDPNSVIIQGWHGGRPFMTGCLINTSVAHSICSGKVIDIGTDDKNDLYSVTIEYNSVTWVRYCLLQTCKVSVGDVITLNTVIGIPYKKSLRFEYCNDIVTDFPVRLLQRQLYKHDPTPVLFGMENLSEVS